MSSGITEAILSAQDIVKGYGAQPVLCGVSVSIHEGERIGLIGRNGSGKSTLLRILAGLDVPDEGLVTRRQGLRVSLLEQDCRLDRAACVGEVLQTACRERGALLAEHEECARQLVELEPGSRERKRIETRYAALHHALELAGAWDLPTEIKQVSTALDLPEPERVVGTLSGGELRRVDLARTLLARPDVLLLDEPTNHIDTRSIDWIESFVAGYRGTCALVTHDRYFLEMVVTRIIEIERTRLYSFPGNYEHFLEYKTQLQTVEAQTEQGRQQILRRELAWMRRGAKARSTKQKARIQRYTALESQIGPEVVRALAFELPAPPRLGKHVLEVEQVSFAYGGQVLFKNFSLIMQRGMRVGLIGPNGCGKTTLLRVLMGLEAPQRGRVRIGDSTQFLYVDQTHASIRSEQSILNFVSNGAEYWEVNGRRLFVPSYLERFLFDRDSIRMPMQNLSGGERNRIELAKKLLQGGNVLVLDEPTNDLDLATLRVLEEAVEAFDGCAFLVSHDRFFLNRLCTHVVAFEGGGEVVLVAGNYDDYLLFKEKRQAALPPRDTPVRTKRPDKPAAIKSGRLTYKEQQELAGIEQAIETAEADVARLEARIHKLGFYEQVYTVVQETLAELTAARECVTRLYARWQELEERRGVGP